MKYQRFEELPVWQAAIKLARDVYSLTSEDAFKARRSLCDQIERAALSVSNNIAEGFDRGTNNDLLKFLYIARGSMAEVRSMLCLIETMPQFRNSESGIRNLKRESDSISKQLGGWMRTLKESDKTGQRHVNGKIKHKDQAKQDYRTYMEELQHIRFAG